MQTTFAYECGLNWSVASKLDRSLQRNSKRFQVSIIDADKAGSDRHGSAHLLFCMHLNKSVHAQLILGNLAKLKQPVIIERRSDQQECIRLGAGRLIDLIFVKY